MRDRHYCPAPLLPAINRSTPHKSASDEDTLVPVTATVDLSALRHNVGVLRSRAEGAELMAVVKADGYGHGALPVVRVLRDEGVRHFAVARPAEAVRLREAGLSETILVLGAPFPNELSVYTEYELDMTVSSVQAAEAGIEHGSASQPIRVHAKVDTGMGRIGLSPERARSVIPRLADAPGVELAGVWTHFATADEPESPFAQTQLDRFESLLQDLDVATGYVHAANTGALLTIGARTHDFSSPLIRTGIALYGLAARRELHARIDLEPVMRLRARVTHLKTVSAGTPISYGARWRAPRSTCIATLGVGYGDGYPRLGSDQATVRIGGEQRPIVGSICMDMCMVDVGPPENALAKSIDVGDEALLFGPAGPTVYDVADWADTIPYEICCGISPRVPRRYIRDKEENEAKIGASAPSSHDLL